MSSPQSDVHDRMQDYPDSKHRIPKEPESVRILVVDDEENVALTFSEILRRHGFVVDTALSGEEAIAQLRETEYDLVITDLRMEGVDGISVLAELRQRAPLTISIVLTGYASLDSAIAAMRQGAYDYLIKPCSIDDMLRTIQHGIDHRRLMLAEREVRANLERLNALLEQRVTERTAELQRVNEELAKANRAKDVFFATLSHELRTPLNAILGWANMLRTKKLALEQSERALEIIERNARQQAQLISDILDLSSIITGKIRLEMRPVDLVSVVNGAVDSIRPITEEKEIGLELKLESSTEPVVGDPDRLQQVALNLLSNAVKFTPAGGLISVAVSSQDPMVELKVSDSGRGIRKDFLPFVFETFTQADPTVTREHGGLGLGLAIARHLVELHKGTIKADSAGEGKGSTFTVQLPIVNLSGAALELTHEVKRSKKEVSNLLRDLNILVVEDQADTLQLLATLLEQHGAQVTRAYSAKEALDVLTSARPDILVSDIAMPDEDGYALMRRIRALGIDIPAVALTAYASAEDKVIALTAGYHKHVAKPVNPEDLVATIAALAGRKL